MATLGYSPSPPRDAPRSRRRDRDPPEVTPEAGGGGQGLAQAAQARAGRGRAQGLGQSKALASRVHLLVLGDYCTCTLRYLLTVPARRSASMPIGARGASSGHVWPRSVAIGNINAARNVSLLSCSRGARGPTYARCGLDTRCLSRWYYLCCERKARVCPSTERRLFDDSNFEFSFV